MEKSKLTNIFATVTHTDMKNYSACLPQHFTIRMSLGCHCFINGTTDELWRTVRHPPRRVDHWTSFIDLCD